MAIKGVSEIRRLPRAGKIRLGIKVPVKGKEDVFRPAAVDYFVVPEEVAAVYGDKPKSLNILFPIEEAPQFFSQFYKKYTAGGLQCRGDGEVATRLTEAGAMEPCECKGESCPDYGSKKCRRIGVLQFLLPDVPGIGVYQISTTSFHSIVNINSAIDYIKALCGRIRMIPLTLKVEDQMAQPNGKKKIVHVLNIDTNIRLADLQAAGQIEASKSQLAIPAPDETEEDLFVEPTDHTEPADPIEAEVVDDPNGPLTSEQMSRLTKLYKTAFDIGAVTEADFTDTLKTVYAVSKAAGLTHAQADDFINRLTIAIDKNTPPETDAEISSDGHAMVPENQLPLG